MTTRTFRTKPGKAFDAVQFLGTEKSAKEIHEFAKAHGSAAWRRPAQVPLYSEEHREFIHGNTDAMALQHAEGSMSRRGPQAVEWIEVGQWLCFWEDQYLRIIEKSFFETEFEEV